MLVLVVLLLAVVVVAAVPAAVAGVVVGASAAVVVSLLSMPPLPLLPIRLLLHLVGSFSKVPRAGSPGFSGRRPPTYQVNNLYAPDLVIRWKHSDSFSVTLDKEDSERVFFYKQPLECHTSPAVSPSEEIKPCRLSLRGTGVAGTTRKAYKAENKAENGLELMAYKP